MEYIAYLALFTPVSNFVDFSIDFSADIYVTDQKLIFILPANIQKKIADNFHFSQRLFNIILNNQIVFD